MKKPRFEDFPTIKEQPKPVQELRSPLEELPAIDPPKKHTASPIRQSKPNPASGSHDTVVSRHHDTTPPRTRTTPPHPLAASPLPYPQQTIEKLRTAVKQLGKEAATHRFTVEEKRALKTIAYEYANKDINTSENEITRIAVNFLLDDYKLNREKSLLARVLQSLNT